MSRRRIAAAVLAAPAFIAGSLAAAALLIVPHPASAQTAREMPAFLDQRHFADLEAAHSAMLAALVKAEASVAPAAGDRGETQRLIHASGLVTQRAEDERALAAEVRARAEALSQRFSADIAAAEKPAVVTPAVAKVAAVEPKAAATMQRAAEALSRARRDLEEATKRAAAAGQNHNSPTWQSAKAEIDEARRRASEAVEQAQRAIEEQKQIGQTVATAAEAPASDKPRDPRMVPPYALGAAAR